MTPPKHEDRMSDTGKTARGWKRLLVLSIGLVLALLAASALLVLVAAAFGMQGVTELARFARQARPWAALFWAGVIWLTARFYWNDLVDWLCRRELVPLAFREPLVDARWRIATFLLALDATLVAGLPFTLFE